MIALFFLFHIPSASMVSTVSNIPVNNSVLRGNSIRHERVALANVEDGGCNTIHCLCNSHAVEGSNFLIAETSIKFIYVAMVFANITSEGLHMVAVENNSLLNAKYSVYVLAHQNITVNGLRLTEGDMISYNAPFPSSLTITFNNTIYVVRLRQVSSLDDIEDPDRPANATDEYNTYDLMSVAISGIPAVLASLAVNIAILVFIKSQKVQKGLPNVI